MWLLRVQLRKKVLNLENVKIEEMFLSSAYERKVEIMIKKLGSSRWSKNKELQRGSATIRAARACFVTLLEDYLTFSDWFDVDARIVFNYLFEPRSL